jgi:hypothetical protein
MDETMIRQVQGPKRVWGMKGTIYYIIILMLYASLIMLECVFELFIGIGVRRINTRGSVKNGITACVSVVANGYHLPTFFIKKGTTPR